MRGNYPQILNNRALRGFAKYNHPNPPRADVRESILQKQGRQPASKQVYLSKEGKMRLELKPLVLARCGCHWSGAGSGDTPWANCY